MMMVLQGITGLQNDLKMKKEKTWNGAADDETKDG